MDRTTWTSTLHLDPHPDVLALCVQYYFTTIMLHVLYMSEKTQFGAHVIRERQRSVDAAASDFVVVGHRLTSIAQLALGVFVVGNSTRPVENFSDLFKRVAFCFGEDKIGDCQKDDQEATDCKLSVVRPHPRVLTQIKATYRRCNTSSRCFQDR